MEPATWAHAARFCRPTPEQSLQREVLAAQDVAASRGAALEGEDVAPRHVVNVDHVDDGVHEPRDPTVQEVENEPAAGCRRTIAGASGKVGKRCKHGQTLSAARQDLVPCDVLGTFVRAEEVVHVRVGELVDSLGRAGAVQSQCADSARVDDALDTGLPCRLQHISGTPTLIS